MQRDESVSDPVPRELSSGVEGDAEGRRMGLDQDIGKRDLVGKVGPRSAAAKSGGRRRYERRGSIRILKKK